MKKVSMISLIIAGVFLVLGFVLIAAAWSQNGFNNWQDRNNTNWTEKKYDAPIDGITSLSVNDLNNSIEISVSPDDQIHITYYESEFDTYDLVNKNGRISVDYKNSRKWYQFFFFFDLESKTVEVLVPVGYAGALDMHTTNGSIRANDMGSLADSSLRTMNGTVETSNINVNGDLELETVNGSVLMKKTQVTGDLWAKTTNGKVTADRILANNTVLRTVNGAITADEFTVQTIEIKTTNSRISFENLNAAKSVECQSTNGAISGTIVGSISDYKINSRTTNGSNNLPNGKDSGTKQLDVSTVNGGIDIDFTLD